MCNLQAEAAGGVLVCTNPMLWFVMPHLSRVAFTSWTSRRSHTTAHYSYLATIRKTKMLMLVFSSRKVFKIDFTKGQFACGLRIYYVINSLHAGGH